MKSYIKKMGEILPYFLVSVLYIVICPFTKVEESFNVQATHDLLYYGLDIDKYDHLEFPGVVPRTFLGAIVVSCISFPAVKLSQYLQLPNYVSLILVRSALALLNCVALCRLQKAIKQKYGTAAGSFFTWICCSQFHLMFYLGRPLPNVFALALVTYGFGCYLDGNYKLFLILLTACCVIIRCDTLVLFAPFILQILLTNRLPFLDIVLHGIVTGVLSLLLSFLMDSLFWKTPLVPELVVLYYNTILNKSSNWGTQPYHWYLTSVIPRLLYNALVFIPFALHPVLSSFLAGPRKRFEDLWKVTDEVHEESKKQGHFGHVVRMVRTVFHLDPVLASLFYPIVAFILLYSILPHKELRFILIIVPALNAIAAVGLSRVWSQCSKKGLRVMASLAYACGVLMITLFFLIPSINNYPGGYAVLKMNEVIQKDKEAGVVGSLPSLHVDVYSAQTGVSRFLETPGVIYNKTEDLTDFSGFDYLLTHNVTEGGDLFEVVGKERCFTGIDWRRGRIVLDNCVYLMRRRDSNAF